MIHYILNNFFTLVMSDVQARVDQQVKTEIIDTPARNITNITKTSQSVHS
jgi:hypothetical protein